jgi:ferredoxin--NADP+ reductase
MLPAMAKPIQTARLTWREDLTDTLARFRFELEGGVPDFLPGQFITLGLPDDQKPGKLLWRAYSIASAPSTKEHLELYVRRPTSPLPGRFTSALWDLPVGGELANRGITGPFTVEETRPSGEPDRRRLLLVGGGTGIAPYVAIAVEMQRRATPREAIVVHGVSYVEELGYRDLFETMQRETADAGPDAFRLRYVPSISRPKEARNAGWTGEPGRAESLFAAPEGGGPSRMEELLDEPIKPERFFVHACGYDGTCKGVLAVLEPRGFRGFRQKREDGTFDIKIESYG